MFSRFGTRVRVLTFQDMSLHPHRHRYDVVVVGARAAGAATALLLARMGHDVLLVDQAFFPSDTISTHQLARPGVVQLHRWGLLPDVLASGAPAIREVSFTAAGETVRRTVKDSAGVDLLVAPRRQVLDTLLADAAVAAGATLSSGITVAGVRRNAAGRVVGVHGQDRSGALGPDRGPVRRRRRRPHLPGGPRGRRAVHRAARPTAGPCSTPTSRACRGRGSSCRRRAARWSACSRPTTTRRASGSRRRPRTRRPRAVVPATAPRRSPRSSRTGAPELAARLRAGRRISPVTGMLRMPNHLRRGVRRRAGPWSATPATTGTPSPGTA